MVARGACVVVGGMHGFWGGMHGCWGACVVAAGVCMIAGGVGHAWLLGDVCGCGGHAWLWGHAWLQGGVCGWWGVCRIRRDTVNERVVCILLECILVFI